jgi:hypothetical protein
VEPVADVLDPVGLRRDGVAVDVVGQLEVTERRHTAHVRTVRSAVDGLRRVALAAIEGLAGM